MQKHRIVAVILCLCLLCFVGCSDKNNSTDSDTSAANSTVSENTASADGGSDTSATLSSDSDSTASDKASSSSETVSSDGGTTQDPVGSENGDGGKEADQNAPTVYLTAEKSGNTVTVHMNVKNNPGVAAYTVKVLYDNEKLTPKTISGVLTQVVSNLQQPNVTLAGTVTAVYANTTGVLEDGELFNITFEVKDGTTGSLNFTIDADKEDFVAPDYAYIDFIKQNINITLD